MWVQALGLLLTALTGEFAGWLLGSVLLGVGTAMVYPTSLASVSDAAEPAWRARALSVYRFCRTGSMLHNTKRGQGSGLIVPPPFRAA